MFFETARDTLGGHVGRPSLARQGELSGRLLWALRQCRTLSRASPGTLSERLTQQVPLGLPQDSWSCSVMSLVCSDIFWLGKALICALPLYACSVRLPSGSRRAPRDERCATDGLVRISPTAPHPLGGAAARFAAKPSTQPFSGA